MPALKQQPALSDYQQYVHALEEEFGFIDQTVLMKCLLMGEEVGELFRAIRKQEHIKMDKNGTQAGAIDEELVDIFIYLCAIANRYGIDLEEAFRQKEIKNNQRRWE
jgi:NTP pyrophosphatase (non-canonical NTP hydrolase)